MEATKQTVEMTLEEQIEFEAFKEEQAAKRAKEQAKRDREAYKELVDETIEDVIPDLQATSDCIKTVKSGVLNRFRHVIDMKSDVLKLKKDGQRSDTFTHSDGNKRITIGVYTTDGYRDTVEDGIAIVKEYIEGLASDEKTKALVKMVLRLLARDVKGTLKASRVGTFHGRRADHRGGLPARHQQTVHPCRSQGWQRRLGVDTIGNDGGMKVKSATLTPGRWIYVCPCGFRYTVSRVVRTSGGWMAYCFKCKQQTGKYYKVMDERLEFEENYNNKLNCDCFTTIRLHHPVKNAIGAIKHVYLKGVWKGDAKIMYAATIRLDQINRTMSKLDTGLLPEECRRLIKSLYKHRPGINWETQQLDYILLEYIKESKEPSLF